MRSRTKGKETWRLRTTAETNDENNEDDRGPGPENNRDDEETKGKT